MLSWSAAAERVAIAPPPGFEAAAEDDLTIVDIIFNGRKVASSPARFNATTITFEDPLGLAKLIPGVRDTDLVGRALSRPQSTNRDRACSAPKPPNPCNYIYPSDVAVIFDPATLQAEIFINDLYTFSRDPRAEFLPPPTVSPGLITSFDTRTAYNFENDRFIGTSNVGAIAGRGRQSVRADLFTNTSGQTRLQSLQASHVGNQTTWTIGLQSASSGGSLARSRQLLGVRWATTLETRMNRQRLNASPLDISVAQSATVEIRRDGQTLDVQQVEPSQTQLDTTRLPFGSYTVDLIIDEGGQTRTESRYYSTSSRLPPSGAPQWYVEVGQAVPFAAQEGFFVSGETPVIGFGRRQRLVANLALNLDATLTDEVRYAELSATAQSQLLSGTVTALASDDGTYGYAANAYARLRDWSFSGSYRKLEIADPEAPADDEAFDPFVSNFEQASLSANRSGRWGRLGVRGFYRKGSSGQESWFGGPYVDVTLLNRRNWRLNMLLRQEWGSDRETSFLGLRLSKSFNRPNKIIPRAYLTARYDSTMTKNTDTGEISDITVAETEIRGDLTRSSVTRTSFYGGVRHEDQLGARAGLNYSSPWLDARLDGRRDYQNQNTALFDVRSGLVFGGHGVSLAATRQDAGVQMSIDGPPGSPVAVQVDRQTRTVGKSGSHAFLPLRGFSIYDVGIQPERTRNIDYQQYTDRLVLYPGNVIQLARSVRPITIIFARLVDPAGTPIPDAFLEFEDTTLGTTGPEGYFQIDASPGDRIIVRRSKEESCEITLPAASNPSDAYLDAGTLTCRPLSPDSL